MFRGSVPSEMRAIIKLLSSTWTTSDIYVGCSGNFTIERVLLTDPSLSVHSNDVTLYSCGIGQHFSGSPWSLCVNSEYDAEFGWLNQYMGDSQNKLATLLLASQMFQFGISSSNAHLSRMQYGYQTQWNTLHNKALSRIQDTPFALSSFFPGDVCDWADTLPRDSVFICFPPFYQGDYESMFKNLDKVFYWDRPTYPMFSPERLKLLIKTLQEFKHWVFGSDVRMPELEDFLIGLVRTTNRGIPIYLYGDSATRHISMPHQSVESFPMPPLMPGEKLGDSIELHKLTGGQFSSLRSQYMNHNILPGSPLSSTAVCVDGKLIGCYAEQFHRSASQGSSINYLPQPSMYLLSDFAVSGTDYPRLSKLVLYAALSSEAKAAMESSVSQRVKSIVTTAFSDRPTSMKYRGLFQLLKRRAPIASVSSNAVSDYTDLQYQLQYGSTSGRWNLQEGLSEWKKQYMEAK